jgi:hypothetical protein
MGGSSQKGKSTISLTTTRIPNPDCLVRGSAGHQIRIRSAPTYLFNCFGMPNTLKQPNLHSQPHRGSRNGTDECVSDHSRAAANNHVWKRHPLSIALDLPSHMLASYMAHVASNVPFSRCGRSKSLPSCQCYPIQDECRCSSMQPSGPAQVHESRRMHQNKTGDGVNDQISSCKGTARCEERRGGGGGQELSAHTKIVTYLPLMTSKRFPVYVLHIALKELRRLHQMEGNRQRKVVEEQYCNAKSAKNQFAGRS